MTDLSRFDKPHPVTTVDMAFGGGERIHELLPKYEEIPEEFKKSRHWAVKLISKWFFSGAKSDEIPPCKPGIDRKAALAHIKTCLGSFSPKHEHKEAGCAYLLAQWFEAPKENKST